MDISLLAPTTLDALIAAKPRFLLIYPASSSLDLHSRRHSIRNGLCLLLGICLRSIEFWNRAELSRAYVIYPVHISRCSYVPADSDII